MERILSSFFFLKNPESVVFHFFFKNHQHVRNVVVTYCGITYMYYLPMFYAQAAVFHMYRKKGPFALKQTHKHMLTTALQ